MASSFCSEVHIISWEADICSDGQDIEHRKLTFLEDIDNYKTPFFENVFLRTSGKMIGTPPPKIGFDAKGLMVSKIFYLKYYINHLLDKRAGNSWGFD